MRQSDVASAIDQDHAAETPVPGLHLRHGLAPVEIADVLGRSPGTVRSQLARGLQFLRNSLPVGFTTACLGLLPGRGLAAVKQTVLEHAAYLAAPGGALLGAFAMKKTTLSLGGLLIVAALAAIVFPQMLDIRFDEVPENGPASRALAAIRARLPENCLMLGKFRVARYATQV